MPNVPNYLREPSPDFATPAYLERWCRGPRGPEGPTGPTGPEGPTGPAGSGGLSPETVAAFHALGELSPDAPIDTVYELLSAALNALRNASVTVTLILLAAVPLYGQSARLGALGRNDMVVTNLPAQTEYAQPFYDYILQHPIREGGTVTNEWLDVMQISYTAPGIHSVRLEAVRDEQGSMAKPETLTGTWSILSGHDIATLEGDTLVATTNTGPVLVRFSGTDGTFLAETVPMIYRPASDAILRPGGEQSNTWRREQFDYIANGFRAIDPAGPKHTYTSRGESCEILDALQQYSYAYQPNPTNRNPDYAFVPTPFSSVGRTDESTWGDRRPVTAITPHYAICAAHSSADGATFVDVDGTVYTRTYTVEKTRGDLRLLRTETALPQSVLNSIGFVRSETISSLSASILAEGVGYYQSQHGTIHLCLVTPVDERGGWSTHPVGEDGNYTYADLAPYAHLAHVGDSGHCVMFYIHGFHIPVGVYHYAGGSADSLMDGDVIDWLNANMVGETVRELTEEDLR